MQHYEENSDTQTANMSMRKTKTRSSTAQINAMINYITKGAQSNRDDFDPSVDIPELGDTDWERLVEILNNIGPAVKNVAAWKISWRDLKRTTRMKQVEKMALPEAMQNFISEGVIPEIAESDPAEKLGYYPNRKMRSSNAQINMLVEYMARNRKFARGELTSPVERREHAREWARLAEVLNETGPAVKNAAAWRVTWRDLARSTRKKQPRTDASAAVADRIEEILGSAGEQDNDDEPDDVDMSSPEPPRSPDGAESRASPSELDSPEGTEDESDSSPSASPTPEDDGGGKPRCTVDQIKALVDCMAINPCMAFGKQATPEKVEDWKRLRQLLNRLGPPKRTIEWRKHWRNLRKTSVLKLQAKAKYGIKIPEMTQKIVEIVEAHKEKRRSAPDGGGESDDESDMEVIPPRVLSPDRNRTSPVAHSSQMFQDDPMDCTQQNMDSQQPMQDNEESDDFQWGRTGEKRSKRRCTNTQITALVEYMSAHPDLAVTGYSSPHENATREEKWRQLTKHLNSLGTAKSTEGWKRTWRDLKLTVRCKRRKLTKTNMYLYQKVQDIMDSKQTGDENRTGHMSPEHSTNVQQSGQDLTQYKSGQALTDPDNSNGKSDTEQNTTQPDFSEIEKVIRCSKAQMNALVNYMCDHPALARSASLGDEETDSWYAEWRQLTKYLNKMGPAKSTSGWRSTWRFLRHSARKQDGNTSPIAMKIMAILNADSPDENPAEMNFETGEEFYVSQPSADDMSTLHLNSPSPLPGYCKTRPTNTQIYALVNYISKHPALAACYTANESQDPNLTEWRLLSRYLNRLGTAKKSTLSWKRTWRDIKLSVVKNRRTPTPWNEKITQKVIEILDATKMNDGQPQSSNETEERLEHPCSSDMSVLYMQSHEQPEVKPEPVTDPLNCDQTEDSHKSKVIKQVITVRSSEVLQKNSQAIQQSSSYNTRKSVEHKSQTSEDNSQHSPASSNGSQEQDNCSLTPVNTVSNEGRSSPERDDKQSRSEEWNQRTKKTRCTNLQLRALTDYMVLHPDLAVYNLTTKDAMAEWRHLTRHLNRMGTAAKSTIAWKRTWRDIKKAVRRGKSGGGLDKAREKKVRVLLGMESPEDPEKNAEEPKPPVPDESPFAAIQRCVEILAKKTDEKWSDENNQTTAANIVTANETDELLKVLIHELRRSNELKAEQNIYLRELLKQSSAHTARKPNTDRNIQTDTENVAPFMQRKEGMEDQSAEDSDDLAESKFCAEEFCEAQLNPVCNGVEEAPPSTISEMNENASQLVTPVSLTAAIPSEADKQTVNLSNITKLMRPMHTMPNTPGVKLKGKPRGRKRKNKTREEKLRQKRIAERLRYEKLRNDPTKKEELKEKERRKYQMRKEKGLVKLVSDTRRFEHENSME